MKLAVVGSREVLNPYRIFDYLDYLHYTYDIDEVISGGAKGVDSLAKSWAKYNNIKFSEIKPDYHKFPFKIAPIIRNKEIVQNSDLVVAFWDGKSKGTRFVIDYCRKISKPLQIVAINKGLNKLSSKDMNNGYSL